MVSCNIVQAGPVPILITLVMASSLASQRDHSSSAAITKMRLQPKRSCPSTRVLQRGSYSARFTATSARQAHIATYQSRACTLHECNRDSVVGHGLACAPGNGLVKKHSAVTVGPWLFSS